VPIDGKTICGSGNEEHDAYHVISVFVAENQITLGEMEAENKKREIKMIPKVLDLVEVEGDIVTIDAAGCYKPTVEKIVEKKADYVIGLKGNQGNMHKAAEEHFLYEPSSYQTVYTEEKNGGRYEKREYYLETELSWLEGREEWTNLNAVGMVKSVVERCGEVSFEIRYFITSLTDADEFAYAVRKHWCIENQLHWSLDVIFREDASKVKKNNAPLNLNVLNKAALTLLKNANISKKVSIRRRRLKAAMNMQPGQNVYWNGFGDPPSLTYRADFNDIEYNRERQKNRELIKGRFSGGNLGWIMPEDLELFTAAFVKPLDKFAPRQKTIMDLVEREPLTIQQMKEETGYLVKEITPVLHRLQEAFLIYEDQYDGEWDRGWHKFSEMFSEVDLSKYTRQEALKILLQRFAYRHVYFDVKMAKSFYKLPEKDIKAAVAALADDGILTETENGYLLREDFELLKSYSAEIPKSVYAMHRNDFLVKSNEHLLKEKYTHSYSDTMYYILKFSSIKSIKYNCFLFIFLFFL